MHGHQVNDPFKLETGEILVVSNNDTINLYLQNGNTFSIINPAVPVTDLSNSSLDIIHEKYRNSSRLYSHGEMCLQINDNGIAKLVNDGSVSVYK